MLPSNPFAYSVHSSAHEGYHNAFDMSLVQRSFLPLPWTAALALEVRQKEENSEPGSYIILDLLYRPILLCYVAIKWH
ncbi:hypothetical protein MHYP_G00099580 [Metynnis hypsauchen]